MVESTSKTLYQSLWNSANILRSKMDANEYKNYLLGLVFYKYLSDNMLFRAANLLLDEEDVTLPQAQDAYAEAFADAETHDDLINNLMIDGGYYIEPQLTFYNLVQEIHANTFQLESLAQGFKNIEQSDDVFENLFEDIDLYSNKLGKGSQKANEVISSVMKELSTLDLAGHKGDVLGDAYEYLIGQFASESGKKAGEFYTPQTISTLMTRIVLKGKENQKGFSVYDPTMGSGSLLLNAKKYSNEPGTINYFGQELNASTYNLARMNMILHGVDTPNQHLRNGDTLDKDWPDEEPTNFDGVMMNPPYSAKWSAEKGFLDDARFSNYGVLAPKSKADFAFLLHGYFHLKNTGVMAIVLPHGVLFRGAAEGKIRQSLLDSGAIDTIIGLPANIFINTSIPTTIIILKKERTSRDVFFIDASNEFTKGKNVNILTPENIEKILDTYDKREDVDKYAHLAAFDEIKENDYNLNIPRYVDTFEEEEPIDMIALSEEILDVNKQIADSEEEILAMLDELVVTDDTKDIIAAAKAVFEVPNHE